MDEEIRIVDDCDGAPDGHGNRWVMSIDFGDGATLTLRMGVDDVVGLFKQVEESGIAGYVRDMRWHEREWARMSPEERAEALGEGPPDVDQGYALDDPCHPTYHERMSDAADRD